MKSNTVAVDATSRQDTTADGILLRMLHRAQVVGMFTEVMTVDPDMAASMLRANTGNRSLNRKKVERYASLIRDDKWMLTSQGISFADNGTLNNGQHRLHGIIEAGMSVTVSVTFGEPRAAFMLLDQAGATRSNGDALHIMGEENGPALASALRALHVSKTGLGRGQPGRIDAVALSAILANHPMLRQCITPGQRLCARLRTKRVGVSSAGSSVGYYYILTESRHAARLGEFWEKLCTGVGITHVNDPILVLRRTLSTGNKKPAHVVEGVWVAALIVLSWNNHVEGKRPNSVTWADGASFPRAL